VFIVENWQSFTENLKALCQKYRASIYMLLWNTKYTGISITGQPIGSVS